MKWFQHHTDAHDDEFLKELMHKYGSDGYTAWWITVELVAKIIKVTPAEGTKEGYKVSARFEATPHVFTDATKIPLDKLETIYNFCAKRKKFRFKKSRERWVVDWPKVLEFKDNATADLIAKYRKELGSPLEVTSGLHTVIPMGTGNGDGSDRGSAGGSGDEDRLFAVQVARQLGKFMHSPSNLSMTKALQDLIRQGVPKRLIAECHMVPEYRTMDFYDMTRDLKKRSGETDGRTGSGDGGKRGGGPPLNPGAKAVVGHFGLKPGELEEKTRQRIADRERAEGEGAGKADGQVQDRRGQGEPAPGDEVPGAEKV